MPPSIVRDLELVGFGYEVVPMAGTYAPQPVAGGIRDDESEDGRRFRESMTQFSSGDVDAYDEWSEWLSRSADFLAPLLMETPPNVGSLSLGDLADQARSRFSGVPA